MKRQLRHGMLLAVAASLFALTGCDSGDTYYDFGYPRTTNNGGTADSMNWPIRCEDIGMAP